MGRGQGDLAIRRSILGTVKVNFLLSADAKAVHLWSTGKASLSACNCCKIVGGAIMEFLERYPESLSGVYTVSVIYLEQRSEAAVAENC